MGVDDLRRMMLILILMLTRSYTTNGVFSPLLQPPQPTDTDMPVHFRPLAHFDR